MRTRTYQDLLRAIEPVIPRAHIEQLGIDVINAAVGRLWSAFPWRQSIGVIPPFYLLPEVAEYPDVISNQPRDMAAILTAWYEDRTNPSAPVRFTLIVTRDVERARVFGRPHAVSRREYWRASPDAPMSSYVIFPVPPPGIEPPHHVIGGTYKRAQPIVSAASISQLLPFEDTCFADLVSIARITAWEFTGDPRAKDALPILTATYSSLAAREGFELGPQTITAAEPFVRLDLY